MNEEKNELRPRALLSLIFGLLAFGPCPCVGSLAAIVLGMGEKSAIGRTGFWLGWAALAATFLCLLFGVGLSLLFGGAARK